MNIRSNMYRTTIIENGTIDDENTYTRYNLKKVLLPLKRHQLKSLDCMVKLEHGNIIINDNATMTTKIGILGDCVGSGKSITTLALIDVNNKTKNSLNIDTYAYNNIQVHTKNINCIKNTTLIVVPHSLVKQWEDYVINFTSFSYEKINNKKSFDSYNSERNYDILIISSSLYNEFIFNKSENKDIQWKRVIFDEADSINIPSCCYPKTIFTWFLTSTIQNLLFVHGYYYVNNEVTSSLNNFRYRGYKRILVNGIKKNGYIKDTCKNITSDCDYLLKYIIIKNKDNFIKESFNIEEPNLNIVHCKNPIYLSILDGVLNNEVLTRLNAGDKEGALDMLEHCNINTANNILEHVTHDINQKINNLNQELEFLNRLSFTRAYDIEQNNKKKEKLDSELQKYTQNLENIKQRIEKYEEVTCPICIDNLEDPVACLSCCKNLFCMKCITRSFQTKEECPLCRSIITNNSFNIIHTKKKKIESSKPTKSEALLQIIKENDKKVLIFSSYDNTFNQLENLLYSQNINFAKLNGNYNHINHRLNMYKNGSLNILLLNSNNFGTGLNLEMTTDIIFYHKMKKDIEQQVIGRAQRFGRPNKLNVHFLYYDNELTRS